MALSHQLTEDMESMIQERVDSVLDQFVDDETLSEFWVDGSVGMFQFGNVEMICFLQLDKGSEVHEYSILLSWDYNNDIFWIFF